MIQCKKLVVFLLVLIISFELGIAGVFAETASVTTSSDMNLVTEKVTAKIILQNGKNIAVLNGKNITLESSCKIINTQFFAPVKSTVKVLGAKYDFNPKTKKITVIKDDIKVIMQVGSKSATVNNKKVQLPAAVISTKSIISAPVKFIAEALGTKYAWNAINKTAVITAYSKIITFPDKALETAIRNEIKKPSGDITVNDVSKIQQLTAYNTDINDLNGIQYLTSLKFLILGNTEISDISPLSSLTKVEFLYLNNNFISDINPLSKMTALSSVSLYGNKIRDLSPLKEMRNLETLDLSNNLIGDISPLKSLPKSTQISLWHETSMERIDLIANKAREIVDKVIKPEMTDIDKELALYDYLITHCKYDKENFDKKTVPQKSHDAYGVLTEGVGVCDGYAETMQILLSMVGIESMVVLGDTIGPQGGGHAWNIVKIDGEYYQFDITFDDPASNDNKDILFHSYFNISDRQMAIDHKWDRSNYPQCSIDSLNFNNELLDYKQKILMGENVYNIIDENLYKIEADGSYKKICEDKLSDINLVGDWIYYINKDDDSKVYKIKIDGTEKTKIVDFKSLFLTVDNNYLYCLYDFKVHKMDLNGANGILISGEDAASYFKLLGDWVYYKAFTWGSGARMHKMKSNGSTQILLGEDKPVGFKLSEDKSSVQCYCAKFESFDNDWVYYINEDDGNKLYKIKLDGGSRTKICDDRLDNYYTEIVNGWIYYQNSNDGNKYYRIKTDGTERQLLE